MEIISRRNIKLNQIGVELVEKDKKRMYVSKYISKACKQIIENAARLAILNIKKGDSIKLKNDIEIKFD